MVEHQTRVPPKLDTGIVLAEKEDGSPSISIGSVDDAVKAFLLGSKSVRWRSEKQIKNILDQEEDHIDISAGREIV